MDGDTVSGLVAHDVPRVAPSTSAGEALAALRGRAFECSTDIAVLDGERLSGWSRSRHSSRPIRSGRSGSSPIRRSSPSRRTSTGSGPRHRRRSTVRGRSRSSAGTVASRASSRRSGSRASCSKAHEEDLARLGGSLARSSQALEASVEAVPRRLWHRIPWLVLGPRRGDAVDGGRRILRDRAPRRGAARVLSAGSGLHGGRGGDADGGGRHQGDVAGSPDPDGSPSRVSTGLVIGVLIALSFLLFALALWEEPAVALVGLPLAPRQHVAGDGGRDGAAVPPGALRSRPRVRVRATRDGRAGPCSRSSPTSRSRSRSSIVAVSGWSAGVGRLAHDEHGAASEVCDPLGDLAERRKVPHAASADDEEVERGSRRRRVRRPARAATTPAPLGAEARPHGRGLRPSPRGSAGTHRVSARARRRRRTRRSHPPDPSCPTAILLGNDACPSPSRAISSEHGAALEQVGAHAAEDRPSESPAGWVADDEQRRVTACSGIDEHLARRPEEELGPGRRRRARGRPRAPAAPRSTGAPRPGRDGATRRATVRRR